MLTQSDKVASPKVRESDVLDARSKRHYRNQNRATSEMLHASAHDVPTNTQKKLQQSCYELQAQDVFSQTKRVVVIAGDDRLYWRTEGYQYRRAARLDLHQRTYLANARLSIKQAIGAAPDAVRMQRVVSFYEKLPRGAAPEVKAKGILGRYQAKHFGKNPTAKRM